RSSDLVANGSRPPVWPAFSARNRWRTRCNAWFELRPRGLSSSRMPSSFLNFVRGRVVIGMIVRGPRLPSTPGGDGMAGWSRRLRRRLVLAQIGQVTQQAVDTFAPVHRIVVVEMQFGDMAQFDHAREPEADFVRDRLESLHRLCRTLGLQRGDEDLGMRHVARDF